MTYRRQALQGHKIADMDVAGDACLFRDDAALSQAGVFSEVGPFVDKIDKLAAFIQHNLSIVAFPFRLT